MSKKNIEELEKLLTSYKNRQSQLREELALQRKKAAEREAKETLKKKVYLADIIISKFGESVLDAPHLVETYLQESKQYGEEQNDQNQQN